MSLPIKELERLWDIVVEKSGVTYIRDIDKKISFTSTKLFPRAERTIQILDWRLSPEFYNDLDIVKALREASKREVTIEILYPQHLNIPGGLCRLREEEKGVKLFKFEYIEGPGFIVVDGKHVLVEGPEDPPLPAYGMTNVPDVGSRLNFEFQMIKDQAQEVI